MCYTDYVVCYFCTGFTEIVHPSIAPWAYSDSILASRYCIPAAQLCLLVKELLLMFACTGTMGVITAACMHPTMMLILLFNLPCSNVCWRNNRWLTPLIRIMECKWSACSHTGDIDSSLAQSWCHAKPRFTVNNTHWVLQCTNNVRAAHRESSTPNTVLLP